MKCRVSKREARGGGGDESAAARFLTSKLKAIGSEQEEAPGNLLPGLLRGLIPPARPGIPSALPRYL